MTPSHDGRSFHYALRACMSEGRSPHPQELEDLAAKIWRDAYRPATGLEWSDVEEDSSWKRRAQAAARAALGIANAFWAELAAA